MIAGAVCALALASLSACEKSTPPPEPPKAEAPRAPDYDLLSFGVQHVGPVEAGAALSVDSLSELVGTSVVTEETEDGPEGPRAVLRVFDGDELLYVVERDGEGHASRIRIGSPMMKGEQGVEVGTSYLGGADSLSGLSCQSGAGAYAKSLLCSSSEAPNISLVFENGTGETFSVALSPEDQKNTLAGKDVLEVLWQPPG